MVRFARSTANFLFPDFFSNNIFAMKISFLNLKIFEKMKKFEKIEKKKKFWSHQKNFWPKTIPDPRVVTSQKSFEIGPAI